MTVSDQTTDTLFRGALTLADQLHTIDAQAHLVGMSTETFHAWERGFDMLARIEHYLALEGQRHQAAQIRELRQELE